MSFTLKERPKKIQNCLVKCVVWVALGQGLCPRFRVTCKPLNLCSCWEEWLEESLWPTVLKLLFYLLKDLFVRSRFECNPFPCSLRHRQEGAPWTPVAPVMESQPRAMGNTLFTHLDGESTLAPFNWNKVLNIPFFYVMNFSYTNVLVITGIKVHSLKAWVRLI